MVEYFKDKNKRKGVIGTILFHLLLLLFFAIYGLPYEDPRPEQGMLINFGTSDQGMGDVQTEPVYQPIETPVENTQQEEIQPESTPEVVEKVITQETVETIEVKPTKEQLEQERKNKEEEERKKKEQEAQQKAQSMWDKINQNTQSGNQGETGKPGDQGSTDGQKAEGAYSGLPGTGSTPSSLSGSGRSWKEVKPKGVQNEEGKVEVLVYVDKEGNVTKATVTKSTNHALNANAEEAAKKWKFSKQEKLGNELQKIIIPFTFTF
jgi:periplasmic protein TonB